MESNPTSTKLASRSISFRFTDNILARLWASSSCKTSCEGADATGCNEILFGLPTFLREIVLYWVVGCKESWTRATGTSDPDKAVGNCSAKGFVGTAETTAIPFASSVSLPVTQRRSLANG